MKIINKAAKWIVHKAGLSAGYWHLVDKYGTGDLKVSHESSMRVSAVMACVRVLAETIASMPLIIYERLPDGGKQRATKHYLYNLLHDSPNDWQTSFEWREMMQGHLALRGNAYCRIITGADYKPRELIPIHPDRVKVERLENGKLRYEVFDRKGQKSDVYNQKEILHLRGLSSDGIKGLSPIHSARKSIETAMAADEFGASFLRNGARPSGALKHPGTLSEEAKRHLKDSIQNKHGGAEKAGKIMVLEEDMEWQEMGIKPDEAQFIETKKYQVTDIARIFRMQPHLIQDLEHATFSNIEQQSLEFVKYTMLPWIRRWEQALTKNLLYDPKKYFVEFLIEGLLRGDIKSRNQAYKTQFLHGAMTIDEWRSRENMNPLPQDKGKRHYVPMNIQPVDMIDTNIDKKQTSNFEENQRAWLEDISQRAAKTMIKELKPRVEKASEDRKKFNQWLDEYYEKYADYLDSALTSFCQINDIDKQYVIKNIIDTSKTSLKTYNPVEVLNRWESIKSEQIKSQLKDGHYALS